MMLGGIGAEQVYLARGATDMRKSINGLAVLVTHAFELDPFSNALFVFCNARRDKLKILYWDHNGFWLLYRRLESGRFRWPSAGDAKTVAITRRELQWLLDGLELKQDRAHAAVTARQMV